MSQPIVDSYTSKNSCYDLDCNKQPMRSCKDTWTCKLVSCSETWKLVILLDIARHSLSIIDFKIRTIQLTRIIRIRRENYLDCRRVSRHFWSFLIDETILEMDSWNRINHHKSSCKLIKLIFCVIFVGSAIIGKSVVDNFDWNVNIISTLVQKIKLVEHRRVLVQEVWNIQSAVIGNGSGEHCKGLRVWRCDRTEKKLVCQGGDTLVNSKDIIGCDVERIGICVTNGNW